MINTKGDVEASFNLSPKDLPDFGNIAYGNFNNGSNTIPIINLKNNDLVAVVSQGGTDEECSSFMSPPIWIPIAKKINEIWG